MINGVHLLNFGNHRDTRMALVTTLAAHLGTANNPNEPVYI